MTTKLVYAIVSDENDIYLEQAVISICSVRKNSPNTPITIVVDERTDRTLTGHRALVLNYIDEKIVIDLGEEKENSFRSRILKTNLRKYIDGPYLFIDTDTIVCRPLDTIDELIGNVNIAAVPDAHCKYKDMAWHETHLTRSRKIGWDLENDEFHFNSGVMFVDDNNVTRQFYEQWYNNWLYERKYGLYFDQLAMAHTNGQMGYPIKELDGIWNCQIARDGIYYFADAYILHLLGGYYDGNVYYFNNKLPYNYIKQNGKIDDKTLSLISKPKSAFVGKVNFTGNADGGFINSSIYTLYKYHKGDFRRLNALVSKYIRIRGLLKKYK